MQGAAARVGLRSLDICALAHCLHCVLLGAMHAVLEERLRRVAARRLRRSLLSGRLGCSGASQRKQLCERSGKVGAEGALVLGVNLCHGAEARIGLDRHVRREHHKRAAWVFELGRAIPLALSPLHPSRFLKYELSNAGSWVHFPSKPERLVAASAYGPHQGDDLRH